jgi:L-cysteine desulfidase
MTFDKNKYDTYLKILKEELVPAMGCTEPIAIAYCSAVARKVLGKQPEKLITACSGNIIKNVKGVIVPNSGGLKGIEVATILGMVCGNPEKKLEVISNVTTDDIILTKKLLDNNICEVELLEGDANLHLIVTAKAGNDTAMVEIEGGHTNIVKEVLNGQILFQKDREYEDTESKGTEVAEMTVDSILEFANIVNMQDVSELLDREIRYNMAISNEGLKNAYGANIGKTMLRVYGNDIRIKAIARAAAGSDARMSGCSMPVIINSGSGNQGMTVSLPVIEYAKEFGCDMESLYRALVISNLISIHQKSKIGKLSAYCGAVSAACGSGAAITYLAGGSKEQIQYSIVNTLANVSGIVCDGAKASCAAKIASALDAAILAHHMAMNNEHFKAGDGIVKSDIEETMSSIGRLGKDGMKETDLEILKIMIDN